MNVIMQKLNHRMRKMLGVELPTKYFTINLLLDERVDSKLIKNQNNVGGG